MQQPALAPVSSPPPPQPAAQPAHTHKHNQQLTVTAPAQMRATCTAAAPSPSPPNLQQPLLVVLVLCICSVHAPRLIPPLVPARRRQRTTSTHSHSSCSPYSAILMCFASFCCLFLSSSLITSSGGTPSKLPLAIVLNVSLTGSVSLLCSPASAATLP